MQKSQDFIDVLFSAPSEASIFVSYFLESFTNLTIVIIENIKVIITVGIRTITNIKTVSSPDGCPPGLTEENSPINAVNHS